MALKHLFKSYSIFFFMFSVYSSNSICSSKRMCGKVFLWFPYIVHIICVMSFMNLLQRDLQKNVTMLLQNSMFFYSLLTLMIPNIIYVVEKMFSKIDVDDILEKLHICEMHLEKFVNVSVQSDVFCRSFRLKCIVSVAMCSLALITKIIIHSPVLSMSLDFNTLALALYRCWIILFIILLIEYTNLLLFSLNQHLKSLQFERFQLDARVWDLVHFLRHIRAIHFQMHKITQMVNLRFGWFLIAIIIDMFNLTINSSFVAFTAITDPNFRKENTRNSKFVFFMFIFLSFYIQSNPNDSTK